MLRHCIASLCCGGVLLKGVVLVCQVRSVASEPEGVLHSSGGDVMKG